MPQEKLTDFYLFIDDTLAQLSATEDTKAYLKKFTAGLNNAAEKVLEIGDEVSAQIYGFETAKDTSEAAVYAYLIDFGWTERAKFFLILWRNTLLELQKAQVLLHTKEIDETAVADLRNRAESTLQAAASDLQDYTEKTFAAHTASEKSRTRFLKPYFLQTNPWSTYKLQIQTLASHGDILQEATKNLLFTADTYDAIESLVRKSVIDCQAEISEALLSLDNIIAFIDENAGEAPGKIAPQLEVNEEKIIAHDHSAEFAAELSPRLKKLPSESRIPVAADNGIIETKDINFRSSTRRWLDSEILPLLYEVWELTEGIRTGLKMSLLNIRNRALLAANDNGDNNTGNSSGEIVTPASLSKPLHLFKETAARLKEECSYLYEIIDHRLNKEFNITSVYKPTDDFLEIPLQNAISQLVFSQNAVFTKIRDWWLRQREKLQRFRTDVKREEALSISEKVVRYLDSRAPDPENSQYAGIFLTKGYIGESFRVGREEEIARTQRIVNQWQEGYRGAVLLTGKRFSGRSLFGDLIANRYFPGNTIYLLPDSEVEFGGRRFQTEHNLSGALDWVAKHTLQTRSMLWLDNLELWSDANHTLSQNVRALQKFIDNNCSRIFIVVSMSNWLQTHMNIHHDIDKYFQAEINMDKMPRADIARAIAIRHGATHRKLVNEKGEEITPQEFNKHIKRVYKQTEGNIGEALLLWSNSIEKVSENEVRLHRKSEAVLPKFISSDTGVLLSAIMLRKRTRDYDLNKIFGSAFKTKYAGILLRLLSLGLVKRHLDGSLEVTETAVNDIGRQLEEKHYLRYHK